MQQLGIKFYTRVIFLVFNYVPFRFSEQDERGDPKEQLHAIVRHKNGEFNNVKCQLDATR